MASLWDASGEIRELAAEHAVGQGWRVRVEQMATDETEDPEVRQAAACRREAIGG